MNFLLFEFASIFYVILIVIYQYQINKQRDDLLSILFYRLGYVVIFSSIITILTHQDIIIIEQLWLSKLIQNIHIATIPFFSVGYCYYIINTAYENNLKRKKYLLYVRSLLLFFIFLVFIKYIFVLFILKIPNSSIDYLSHAIPFIVATFYYIVVYLIALFNKDIVNKKLHNLLIFTIIISIIPIILYNSQYSLLGLLNFIIYIFTFLYLQNSKIEIDFLTKLNNKCVFMKESRNRIKQGADVVFVLVKLNKYKDVNVNFGQKIGDDFIIIISNFLKEYSNKVYRYSGTSFIVTLENDSKFKEKLNSMNSRLKKTWTHGLIIISISVKISFLIQNELNTSIEESISLLEVGQNRIAYSSLRIIKCGKKLKEESIKKDRIISIMHKAIKDNKIELEYLPIYDSFEKKYIGVEALLRIADNEGVVYPEDFLSIADESGMIVNLDLLVIRNVLSLINELEAKNADFSGVSFNLNNQHFKNSEFAQELILIIKSQNVDPKKIIIDVKENVLAKQSEGVAKALKILVKEGFRFHLDDFGVGYSNLASILSLPFEAIKIEGAIIEEAIYNNRGYDILKSIIDNFKENGISLLAERIETTAQLKVVKKAKIRYIQGCHFSCPIEKDEVFKLFEKNSKTIA